jgi:hypothetical protein
MVELLFIAQAARRPIEAMARRWYRRKARRWYCHSLFRATRGRLRCQDCTAS